MSDTVFSILGVLTYIALFLIALWGAFCVVMVWARIEQKRFRDEDQQGVFLESIEEPLMRGEYDTVSQICEGDRRATCQLVHLAVDNRKLGYAKVKQLIIDRFQRDVLADLDFRLSWVYTVIKSAPMVGLLGTVMGMMGAFAKLGLSKTVEPDVLAKDIQFALITTACGLAIAIPLVMATASINIKIRKMEDITTYGLNQFLEIFRESMIRYPQQ